jgi:hypothetical protein
MNYDELTLEQLVELVNEQPENEAAFDALQARIAGDPEAFQQLDGSMEELSEEMMQWLAIDNEYEEEDEMQDAFQAIKTRGLEEVALEVAAADAMLAFPELEIDEIEVETEANRPWRNWVSTERLIPKHTCYPRNLRQLQTIIRKAEAEGKSVRAFGSGHAISDVAVSLDYIINTSRLNSVLPLGESTFKREAAAMHLIQVEGGIKIGELNKQLALRGLALSNMGGSTIQSLAGAISTSTHGSGITLGPFPSFVKSLLLVSTAGKVYRIEPSDGITDPDRWLEPHITLIQDDDHFNAVLVNMGCMGVIYAFTIAVEPAYLLKESRQLSKWSDVKTVINTLGLRQQLEKYRHLEFLINPHETHGDHTVIITKRVRQEGNGIPKGRPGKRNCLPSLLAGLKITPKMFIQLFNLTRKKTPQYLDTSLKGLDDEEFTNHSYEVLNQGTKQLKFVAGAIEVAFPVDRTVEAIEKVMEVCARNVRVHGRYLTSPIGVRFVKKSRAYLSMMHDQDSCLIEVPSIINTKEWKELLIDMEQELLAFGGRPHWGLNMKFKGDTPFRFEDYYPEFHRWQRIYQHYNSRGTFDNKFTNRLSISMRP